MVYLMKVVSLGVNWQCRAYSSGAEDPNSLDQPNYLITGEDLKR
jgi:hypothetical protein